MDRQTAYDWIARTHVVAGMRGAFKPDVALKTASTMMDHGISVFELTMNSEQPLEAMAMLGPLVVAGADGAQDEV